MKISKSFYKLITTLVCAILSLNLILPPKFAYAQTLGFVPAPHSLGIVSSSANFRPLMLCGLKTYPQDPLRFDFIIDSGDERLTQQQLKSETERLIRYFLACLTISEKDLWVNLSPYESDRIIPDNLGQTEAGQELLAQDYLLKRIASSLIYPEEGIGKKFWEVVYQKSYERYGTTQIPVNTFNKIWIVPQKAVIYHNADRAIVTETRLKVMLEKDFIAWQHAETGTPSRTSDTDSSDRSLDHFSSDIVKEIILPEIEREVNEGKNFAPLRQIFHSLVLATWYKKTLANALINQAYADQGKVDGIDLADKNATMDTYQKYVDTFKQGIYNFIKVEQDPYTHRAVSRKYFSGGFFLSNAESWIDAQAADSPSFIDQQAGKIYRTPGTVEVKLLPTFDKGERTSSAVASKQGIKRFLLIAAFGVMLGVVAPISNLFAGTSGDRYVGEKYGNPLYQTEDGRAYSVVPKWGNPSKATGTVSGIGAAAIAYADDIGMNISQDAVLYWDVIDGIAKINNISPEENYLIHPGDTIWISKDIPKSTSKLHQSSSKHSSQKIEQRATTSNTQDPAARIDQNSGAATDLRNSTAELSDPTAADSIVKEHYDLQSTQSQLDSLQDQILALEQKMKELVPQKPDTASKIIAIGNPPPDDDSLSVMLASATKNILALQQQLDDLRKKKQKITVDFERKVEAKLSIKDGVGTVVSKGGDAKFTFRQGKTKFEANFKFEGNMQPGLEGQNTYIKKHFLLEQDSIFGQPLKARAGWNFNHTTDPYFFGFDVYPQKLFSKKILLSAGLDAYYPMVSLEDEISGIVNESRQRVYMPRVKLDWKINSKTVLSFKGEGAYSQDPFSKEYFSNEEYTLSLKRTGKKGDHTISLVQGFTEPKVISNLTSLSTDPGPYRIGYERGLKVLGSKGAIGGYWAFDKDFKTQGAKIWIKFNGPLDYAKWRSDGSGASQTGIVFSSETDFALNPKFIFAEPDPITTYGDMVLGMNFKNFLHTNGDLYFGFRSDFDMEGPSLKTSNGQISKPRLNLEYDFAPENPDISSVHLGLRQGHPMIGMTLDAGSSERFAFSPETNIYYLGQKNENGKFLGEIDLLSGLRLTDQASLWANPRILWPLEGDISLGGSLTLLFNNYGLEFFKDFTADPGLMREIGYLPYGYDWRIGPIVNFPAFSGGIFYGQEQEKGFFGIRATLKINKNPQDNRRAKVQNDLLQKPFEKKQTTSSDKSSSTLLLAKDKLFTGSIGGSNLSLWTFFKERLKNIEFTRHPSDSDQQRPRHILFINAFGSPEDIVEQVTDALIGVSEQQSVYLTIELHTEKTINHIAVFLDARSLSGALNEQLPLQEILTGVGRDLLNYVFYIHVEEILGIGDVYLKTFLMTQNLEPYSEDAKLKNAIIRNLASIIHDRYAQKRIFATFPENDSWFSGQFKSYFPQARIHSFSKFNNTVTLQAFVDPTKDTLGSLNANSAAITSSVNGGISLQGQYLQTFDETLVPQEQEISAGLPLDLHSIQGFIPVIIHIVPFTGFYTFFQPPLQQGLAQLAAYTVPQ